MSTLNRWLGPLAVVALFLAGGARPLPAGELALTVLDESGAILPCRVLVRSGERCFAPADAVTLKTGRDVWFMSPGRSQVDVPDGDVLLRVEHGHEYVRAYETVRIGGNRTQHTVRLRRWINLRERGYLAGENHLHVDSAQLGPMLAAEGLDFGSSLTWWRGPDARRPIPPGEGRVRMLEFAGRRIPTSIYDAELEYAWGAAYIQNLPAPMPLAAEPGRPNLDYLRHAADAGALVHYQGGWSREVLLDALLGCVHTVNVCNNNFGLHRFQPRSRYSNLLAVEGLPVYADTDVDMMRMNTDTYYRLLNCGLRLAAGAGTATGVKEAPVGYNRAYVRVGQDASLADFNEAWRAGRNFVTNGPMLFLETDSGARPGDTIRLPAEGGQVALRLEVRSKLPLTSVEVVVNGAVVESHASPDPYYFITIGTGPMSITRGSWIAVRCTARDDLLSDEELARYEDEGSRPMPAVRPSRLRFAHTSPIYVTVGGRGPRVERSLDEARRMLDAFEVFANAEAGARYQDSIHAAIAEARKRLETQAGEGASRNR